MSALTGNFVSQSYQRLVQLSGSQFTDGTGSLIVSNSFSNITVTNGTFTNLTVGGSPVATVSALGAYTTTSSFNSLNSNFTAVSASLGIYATTGSNVFSGSQTIVGSVAQGDNTFATGQYSHAEGEGTISSGSYSHAEGLNTQAIGDYSHAEGKNTQATGDYSHAEGTDTEAIGNYSHAEGFGTVALGSYQHVQGRYNISSSAQSAFIIGNGIDDNNRSDLVFASGSSFQITGSLTVTGSIFNNGFVILTQVSTSFNFADDAAAAIGNVPLGGLYHTSGSIKIRLT